MSLWYWMYVLVLLPKIVGIDSFVVFQRDVVESEK